MPAVAAQPATVAAECTAATAGAESADAPEASPATASTNAEDGEPMAGVEQVELMPYASTTATRSSEAAASKAPKRLKVIDLKSLWTRAAAKPKLSTASASTPLLQTVESRIQSDTPSVHLQTHNELEVEPEVASTEPQVVGDAAIIHEDQHEGIDDDDHEAFYDIDWLPHDPGERIAISDYNVNDQAAGLACRGHDESDESLNKGNFLELLNWLAESFEDVNKVVLKNAPKNCKLTSPMIQKELINCCAKETTKLIIEDLGDDYFAILADESSDVYQKEQLALCIHYVDKKGRVVERFLGIVHVENTTSLTLKNAIEKLLMDHSLSLSRIRGQGYDGASNMKGALNGLKKLIMDYVHCFAHQLQLTLVAVAKENQDCKCFFEQLGLLLAAIGNSCKRLQMLRVAQADHVIEALELGVIESGRGLNQEMGLGRPGDTRWGSHYKTIQHIILMYEPIRKVLQEIGDDPEYKESGKAEMALCSLESFEFVFLAHLLDTIFGYTDDLNCSLQKRDQDVVNAIFPIYLTKTQLELLREDNGWESFLADVTSFFVKRKIDVPNMDDIYKAAGRSKRKYVKLTNYHRFKVDMFLGIIDRQLKELNDRFDEVNTDLLIYMSSFNPKDSFATFDKENLMKLAKFYPKDFSVTELRCLSYQLGKFIIDVRGDERFRKVKNIAELSVLLVETDKHAIHAYVYKLLKLVLLLPVATASVERAFSALNFVKNKLRNSMGDQYLNDCLAPFIEKEFFLRVADEDIISRFQKPPRRVNL
ncbi:zinc finger MYM-type protein 1-like [Panicum virgatum]|uniref:zinc finger MYM-type protein 1-like n=1 Tax=Panicum virgatum TaxID=38727 RepID=UPI0019D67567|nr:zinc finger MYM-type protein 1-like [Panicum virgatum]